MLTKWILIDSAVYIILNAAIFAGLEGFVSGQEEVRSHGGGPWADMESAPTGAVGGGVESFAFLVKRGAFG